MCGIAGFIDPRADTRLLERQLASILHRGPDGEGSFVADALHMGMRRLSIIDLEGGWQPLYGRGKRVVAFQNGEIYNYKLLRAELQARGYVFATQSDTEILAHGYDAWGMDGLLARIDGMFALAIADLDTRTLHLARDRFGEKPLYFAHETGRFVYASSLKAVAAAPWVRLDIDPWALERYIACHFVSGRRTLFKKIHKVLPGERLEIDLDAAAPPRLTRYYRPSLKRAHGDEGTVEEIDALLEEAVESRLVADVPVGIFLSGGIDSSLIAAFASRHHSDIEAFCIAFDDSSADESVHAKAVADHLGMRINTFRFDARRFNDLLPTVCAALDEPIGDQAALPVHWLSQAAAGKVKVVLSGEGADEIFGGYGYYAEQTPPLIGRFAAAHAAACDERGMAPGLLVEARNETQSGFPLLTSRRERDAIVPAAFGAPDDFERDLVDWLGTAHDPLQRKGAADLASWLPDDLLVKADRMTMTASIEGRAPFLMPRLVERALSLPVKQKYRGRESKVLLRQVARRLLPASVVDRGKHGFVLPMTQWVGEWFKAHGGFAAYMRGGEGLGLDLSALESLYHAPRGHSRERLHFALISLVEWWKAFQAEVAALRDCSPREARSMPPRASLSIEPAAPLAS